MSFKNSQPPNCCFSSSSSSPAASAELKLYQAFIFSVPVFFTFILLFLFYLFYLRRRRVDWSSLRMRSSLHDDISDISRAELGLKKEVREMLPIIIYKESFSVKDTQCSVCLGDYQAEDKLQQIPSCGHTFHMCCIDKWLAAHTTCPLCRLSLLPSAKASIGMPNIEDENNHETSVAEYDVETSLHHGNETHTGDERESTQYPDVMDGNERMHENAAEEEERSSLENKYRDDRNENERRGCDSESTVQ